MNNNSSYGLGWYLKETDKAITRFVDRSLEEQGLTRFHWQILNRIHMDGVAVKENLFAKNYVSPVEMDNIIDSLGQKGWVEITVSPDQLMTELRLTTNGEKEFETVAAIVSETGKQMFQVITTEEYEATVDVLTRLIQHLNK